MKREKAVGIAFVALNLILIVVCIVLYSRRDKTEPKFLIQAATIIYTPEADTLELMEGIEAYDNRDGDVTARIVIEKIVEDRAKDTVTVYYAVSDKAGNVAKFSKLFPAELPEEKTSDVSDETNTAGTKETLTGEGNAIADQPEQEDEGNSDDSDTAAENEDTEETEPEETEDDQDTAEAEQNESPDQSAAAEPQPAPQPAAPVNTGAPELVLKSSEATIQAGTNVPWTEIITTLRDDKDDYATLYYNLHVSQYNRNKPGSYPVTVYVEDSDGNTSRSIPFTIIVQ